MNQDISREGRQNLERLVNLVRFRLQDKAKAKTLDLSGNVVYIDTNIYSQETLEAFIELSISNFNQTPLFTDYSVENSRFVDCFADVLVEGAVLYALSSQALLERGREFQISDGGLSFTPPGVAEMLNTQFSTLLHHHWEKVKHIKLNIEDFRK